MISRRHIVQALKVTSLVLIVVLVIGFVVMSSGGRRLLSVQSGSMVPSIQKGDLVSVKRVPLSELAVGDVITFVSPDRQATITHRVVALKPGDPSGDTIVTKGDANEALDQPIEPTKVVGKVEHTVPFLGRGLDFLRTWPGLVLLVYIPALVICISEIRRLAAYYQSQRYVLPESLVRHMPAGRISGFAKRQIVIASVAMIASLAVVALPVRAALQNTATLTGNTISATTAPPPGQGSGPSVNGLVAESIVLRRVFIACEAGQDQASSVHIILYNATTQDIDVSDWTIKSGSTTLLILSSGTFVHARSTFDTEAPIAGGISYSQGALTLHNKTSEQINELTWNSDIRTDRACRIRDSRT